MMDQMRRGTMRRMTDLVYLNGYPPHVLERVSAMLSEGTLAPWLAQRYPEKHSVQTDKALYDFAIELKQRYLKNAAPLAKVLFDNQMVLAGGTLGTNTFAARVQGGNLKRKKRNPHRQPVPPGATGISAHDRRARTGASQRKKRPQQSVLSAVQPYGTGLPPAGV